MDLIKFIGNRIEDAQKRDSLERLEYKPLLDNKVQSLIEHYNPNKGRLSSWWQGRKSDSRSNLIESLNREQRLVIEQAVILENAVMAGRRRKAEFQNYIAQHAALFIEIQIHTKLVKKAAKRGLNLETHLRVREEELLSKIRIKEYKKTEGKIKPLKTEKGLSKIKLNEYKVKSETDFNIEVRKAQEELRLAIIAKHLDAQQKIAFIQELIKEQYIQIDDVRNSTIIPVGAKPDIIASHERIIAMYMIQQDEAQKAALHP